MKSAVRRIALVPLLLLILLPGARAEEAEKHLWPTSSRIIVQRYTPRTHEAIDIAGQLGDSVFASKAGSVAHLFTGCENVDGLAKEIRCQRAGCSKKSRTNQPYDGFCNYGYGNGVVLQHDDGSFTAYGHFSSLEPSLKRGDRVEQGQRLGGMGSSGRSSGVHLHFAVTMPRNSRFTQNRRDPAEVFDPFVYVTTAEATQITARSAHLEGLFSYLGEPPQQVGLCLGLSESGLTPSTLYLDTEYPDLPYLKMFYDVDNIGGLPLEPGTTYYWRCYALTGGRVEFGEIKRFTTSK